MKKITLIILSIFMFCLTSCTITEYATTQDDIYTETSTDMVRSDVDINIVLSTGVPYYYNGSILYYVYNGLYYYPFYYDNYWYMRVYRRPFNHLYYRPYFRPHRYDYRFHRGFNHPRNWYYCPNNRPINNHHRYNRTQPRRPNIQPDRLPNRPQNNVTRPYNTQPSRPNISRPNTRNMNTTPRMNNSRGSNGHFGGARSGRR